MPVRVADELKQMNDLTNFPVARAGVLWIDKAKGQEPADWVDMQTLYNEGGFGGGSGADKAEDVGYTNDEHPTMTDVKKALDELIAKVYYVEPAVSSFTMTPAATQYEVGQSVASLDFAWTYNKDVVSQSLTDVPAAAADPKARAGSFSGPITSNKTFTLSCSDGTKSASASKTISFSHKIYWGVSDKTDAFDSAFILGLANKEFASGYKGKRSMNAGSGQYAFVACPASWGMPNSCKIGGFGTDLVDCGTISFTNASGGVEQYKIVRTSNAGLGAIEMLFE